LGGDQNADPYFYSVALLCHFDGANGSTTFTDSSASPNDPVAHGDAQLTTTGPMYGTACATFDGTGDYALTPVYSGPPTTGTGGQFCFEGWFYPGDSGVFRYMGGIWDTSATPVGWSVARTNTGVLTLNVGNIGGATAVITGTTVAAAGAWHHWALTRDGSAIRLWLDGVLEGSYSATPGGFLNWQFDIALREVLIGAWRLSSSVFIVLWLGKIDEVRLTFGTARYTSAFAPAGPFPSA
jgi:hypothetical protein